MGGPFRRLPSRVVPDADGREWMFNAAYEPIAMRSGGVVTVLPADHPQPTGLQHGATAYLCERLDAPWFPPSRRTDADNRARAACIAVMREWGLSVRGLV